MTGKTHTESLNTVAAQTQRSHPHAMDPIAQAAQLANVHPGAMNAIATNGQYQDQQYHQPAARGESLECAAGLAQSSEQIGALTPIAKFAQCSTTTSQGKGGR